MLKAIVQNQKGEQQTISNMVFMYGGDQSIFA